MDYLSTKTKKWPLVEVWTVVRDTLYHSSGMDSDSHMKETGILIGAGSQSGRGNISLWPRLYLYEKKYWSSVLNNLNETTPEKSKMTSIPVMFIFDSPSPWSCLLLALLYYISNAWVKFLWKHSYHRLYYCPRDTIGRFSSSDGISSENITFKMNLHFSKLCRIY